MGDLLGRYTDPAGRQHLLVLVAGGEGSLLLDRSSRGALVVARLARGEGREQALAVLCDAEADTEGLAPKPPIEGYLARAARTPRRLCRPLSAQDLPKTRRGTRRAAA